MVHEKGDSTKHVAKDQPAGNDAASKAMLAEVHNLHVDSLKRNYGDNEVSVRLGLNADKKGIALAADTTAQSEQLKKYLASGGDFGDAEGKKLGNQFVAQLRREGENHKADRAGAQEFVGEQTPERARQQALRDNSYISEAAAKLADPRTSAHDRVDALSKIENSAASIGIGLNESNCAPGKDQKDAVAESKVIAGDVKALQNGNLTSEQGTMLVNDIASKSGLIRNELNDIPNEANEIKHDSAAIASGAKLETLIKHAMAHPGHARTTLGKMSDELRGLNRGDGSGVLEAVSMDRRLDMKTEPVYMKANTDDNERNNARIIEFTNPYKKVESR